MATPKKRPTRKKTRAKADKFIVRGPDGSLYILFKNKPPYKLKAKEEQAVKQVLHSAQKQVEENLSHEMQALGSGVYFPTGPCLPPCE
jgi:hypothetical protein